ncbi:MAG: DEAD/DEAH box helicase, partial [Planctomycetaceae bacterium]|nr:DEAD/DEAH box helicase [Planctomycetaceae bacterium]
MPDNIPSRDDLAGLYLDSLPYEPYPVQEDALLAWFTAEQGVMVCAPTGMGKTLIAEAALFEALHTRTVAYYTTPLIALTEQKFREMQDAAVRWGFSKDDIGLVTGNRCVNPEARILVVVAEILLNRLLHTEAFDFADVSAVVMDEFHSFNDFERGVVWELSLGLLPKHVRLLLLSATVGNSAEFIVWLSRSHGRTVRLIQSSERRVPLRYQ